MVQNIYESLLFILLIISVQNECIFSTYMPVLDSENSQFTLYQELPKELIQEEMNAGFRVWMKYSPLAQIKELQNRELENVSMLGDQIVIEGGQFIYSIEQSNDKFKFKQQKITHKLFYSFSSLINTLSFEFDIYLYEGRWIMFYCYFDVMVRQTLFGFYNNKEALQLQVVNDLPRFIDKIAHQVGNVQQYKDQQGNLIILSQFKGGLSSVFSSKQDNIFLDLDSCSYDFFSYIQCLELSYKISKSNQEMIGDKYIKVSTEVFELSNYFLNGWIVLRQSQTNYLETIVFRITANQDYSDDLKVGDRDFLLKYYQSRIPSENGIELSTYSYTFPIKKRYKTNDDDKIQLFGDKYSELIIKWHYFQYEIGTQNNNQQPLFSIYFPSISEIQYYSWSKTIRHFSETQFYIYLGGDDYSKNYLKGFVSDIYLQQLCKHNIDAHGPTCHYTCSTCDGPTKNNCVTCPEGSFRQLSKTEKTCACIQRYVDKDGVQVCQSAKNAFPLIQIQEVELNCQLEGYNSCNSVNIECSFGYFEQDYKCIQWYKFIYYKSPNYFDIYSGTKITCLDCFIAPKQFSQTLTCKMSANTYHSNSEYLFIVQQRKQNDYLYYKMVRYQDASQELQLCQGFISQGICKLGFYLQDNQCMPCIQGCRICIDSQQCQVCYLNYYLNTVKQCGICQDCKSCSTLSDGLYHCYECYGDSILFQNKCISCGDNCQVCDKFRYCQYCQGLPSEYYLSIDGQNCSQCNIENCLYCYDYILNGGNLQTTLDINFKVIDQKMHQVNVGCALCKENYHYNYKTQRCELKSSDDECEFAIIEYEDQKKKCIISKTDKDAIQVSDCSTIQNCISCIHNYSDFDSFCIICEDGYYSGVLSGQCIECGQTCKTCIQQNKKYRDFWKWKIKAFYQYVINDNYNHSFENYASTNSESDLNLVCTSCHYGQILYDQKCIQDCDSNCNKCEIINGKAQCVQCLATVSGFIKSQNQDGFCLKCPSDCKACYDRSEEEIHQINPYFILTDSNKYQTRICYEKSISNNPQEKYHYDSITQTIVVCSKYEQCYNKVIIHQNLHCDSYYYNDQLLQSNDEFFTLKNYILLGFLQDAYFKLLQSQQLFDYLNDISTRYVQFEYTIIQGNVQECKFRKNLDIFSSFAQKIFSLQQVDIKMKGKKVESINPINLSFDSGISISNFTIITFENINFDFGKDDNSENNYSIISLNNLKNELTLRLIDCKFETQNKLIAGQVFKITSNIPYSLQIINLEINNFEIYQSEIFTFISQNILAQNYIQITNMTIRNSQFINSSLIKFNAYTNHLKYKSSLQNITITDSQFVSSNFFICQGYQEFTIGSLVINQMYLRNVLILKNSNIFLLNIVESASVFQLILNNSQLHDNSSLYSSNVINIQDCIINETIIESSILLQNQIEYTKSVAALNQSQKILINNLKLLNINYDNKQQILKILKYDEINQLKFQLMNLEISNCICNKKIQNTQISYEQVMIHVECQICKVQNVQISRGYGLPEITILQSEFLEIRNFKISQDQKYFNKLLHSNLECVKQYLFWNWQYQNVFIDNLNVSNCTSINAPIFIFQGYDLMHKNVNEIINVQNSFFTSNLLLITSLNKKTAIIALESKQTLLITFSNTSFCDNLLNEYYQSQSQISSTTLLLSVTYGTVIIQGCQFYQNLVTNSTDSILYIDSQNLTLQNSKFKNNNIVNNTIVSKFILLQNNQEITTNNLQLILPIKSNSGNGMLKSTSIMVDKISIDSSISIFRGGFYIIVSGIGLVHIQNSVFVNTKTSLSSLYFSKGGCFYIEAGQSKLTLKISNVRFDSIQSRTDGGAIFINPSEISNFIEFEDLLVKNCFSMSNQFFSYTLSKKDTVLSQVTFQNITFYSNQEGLEKFYSLLDGISDDDAFDIIQSNPLVFVQYGNFSIYNSNFLFIENQFLLKIVQAQNIILSEIKILNSSIEFSALIHLNLRQSQVGNIQIFNIQITQINQVERNEYRECQTLNMIFFSQLECPLRTNQINAQIIDINQDAQNLNQLICNQIKIFQNSRFNVSLIEISQINQHHKLKIEHLEIQDVYCPKCQFGLLKIIEIEQQQFENIKISNIVIQNSRCGRFGCLYIANNSNNIIVTSFFGESRILQQYNYVNLINKLIYQVIIENSKFLNNSASFGGSLIVVKLNTIIINCVFKENKAEIGGAIYYRSDEEQLLVFDTKIIENKADVAGGIYLSSQSLLQQFYIIWKQCIRETTISNNIYRLRINILAKKEITNFDNEIAEQIIIIPYKVLGSPFKANQLMLPSGMTIRDYRYFDPIDQKFIAYNLTFRIIALNKFQNQIKGLSGSSCTLNPRAINQSSQMDVYNIQYSLSQYDVMFNETSGDYNLDNLIVYFNPTYHQDIILRLLIQCDSISIPEYQQSAPFQIQNYMKNYKLLVDIRTFPCQLGEFLNLTSGGCVLCDTFKNQYQVSRAAQNCSYKDDTKINSLDSAMIELREHYWRAYYYSQTIENCYHLVENCKGGWKSGDESCSLGHIGALCEQCDLYNIRGNGSYSVSSSYSCGSCDQIVYNFITIIFVSLWTLISTLISVNSTEQMNEEFTLGLRLKAFGVTVAIKEPSTAILIKVSTNYLQIISTISTFQLQVPVGLASVVNNVGNPIESLAYSLDCNLVTITDILIIYFRIIWSLIMTISYIMVIFSLGAIAIFTKKISFNISFISTSLIYLFIYLQPNLIRGIISLLSYRKISDEYWIQGNVAYRYDTLQHAQWRFTFCLPLLFIFGCILPFFLWYGVHKNKNHLQSSSVRKIWGYLYNEYQLHAYFWETLKILQKEIILIVLAYYDDHVPIKASLVFLVLFGYSFITIKQRPYMTGQLNRMDTQSTVICAVSIILASSIYTAQQQQLYEILWPFYIIIAFLNGFYMLRMILQILFAYFNKLHNKIDTMKELIQKQTHRSQQSRIKKRFCQLKQYLMPQALMVLEFKKQKGFQLSSKNSNQNYINKEKQDTDQQFSAEIFSANNLMHYNILQQIQRKKLEYSFPNNKIVLHSFPNKAQQDNYIQNSKKPVLIK